MTPAPRLSVAMQSDTGRTRANNEDAIVHEDSLGLLVLADGMGGYNAGEVASRLAATTVLDSVRRHYAEALPEPESGGAARLLRDAIHSAHGVIRAAATTEPQYAGMGTTIVCGLVHGDRLSVAHVGDSRLYLWRDGQLQQLTRDHSLVEEMIARGAYAREDASRFVRRNIVTRALGIEPGMEVELSEHPLQPGDVLLLCSDGLTDMIDDPAIAAILGNQADNLASATETLIAAANAQGGRDNISVMLARVEASTSEAASWYERLGRWLSD